MIKKMILSFIVLIVISIFGFAIKAFYQTYEHWNAYYKTSKTSVLRLNKKYIAETKTIVFTTEISIPEYEYYCRMGTLLFFIATSKPANVEDILADKKCIISLQNREQKNVISSLLNEFKWNQKNINIGYGIGKILYPVNATSFAARSDNKTFKTVSYHVGNNKVKISIFPIDKNNSDKLYAALFFVDSTEKAARFGSLGISIIYLFILGVLIFIFKRLASDDNLLFGSHHAKKNNDE